MLALSFARYHLADAGHIAENTGTALAVFTDRSSALSPSTRLLAMAKIIAWPMVLQVTA
jgi:hypothetical protein